MPTVSIRCVWYRSSSGSIFRRRRKQCLQPINLLPADWWKRVWQRASNVSNLVHAIVIGDGFGILVVGVAMFMWDVLFFIRFQGASGSFRELCLISLACFKRKKCLKRTNGGCHAPCCDLALREAQSSKTELLPLIYMRQTKLLKKKDWRISAMWNPKYIREISYCWPVSMYQTKLRCCASAIWWRTL